MRRLAAVFSSKRDKSDSHNHTDRSHPSSQPAKKHLKLPLSIGLSSPQLRTPSSIASTPQLSSVSDHGQSSGSSSGSASLSLPTPEEDGQVASLGRSATRRSWKDWLGGRRSEPEPPPLPNSPKPLGWDQPVPAWDERPHTFRGSRAGDRLHRETESTGDDASEDFDDEGLFPTPDVPHSPVTKPSPIAAPARARHNIEVFTNNGIHPPFPATPFVQHSPDSPFPRSCSRPRHLPVFDMRRVMFKRRLLKQLESLSPDDEKTIMPFASRNTPAPSPVPHLPSHEAVRPPSTSRIFAASPGLRRWISRPCFEDRYSIFFPSSDGLRMSPIVGTLAVSALEYSEFLDVMVDPDFDPSFSSQEPSQEIEWTPLAPVQPLNQSPPPGSCIDYPPQSPSVSPRPPLLPSPSPLRNQHNSDVSLPESTSQSTIIASTLQINPATPSQASETLPKIHRSFADNDTAAAPGKRVVRFAEEDSEDVTPLHLVRQQKKQEEKTKFLRAEQRKRMVEQEQERRRREVEAMEYEKRRLAKEAERREREKKQYAELVSSMRYRRESQRAGIIPGLKLDANGSLLNPSPSATSLRETERIRPHDSRSSLITSRHPTGSPSSIPRREASDSALSPTHHYPAETSSYRTGSGGYSPGGSTSGHGHQSRPGSMYSSSSEDGRPSSKRYSMISSNLARPASDRTASYPMWSGSNHSLHKVPPLPSLPMMPELMNDFVLLPPSAPFMMHSGRQSRNSSPGRSNSSSSLRGDINSSTEHVNVHRSSSRPRDTYSTSSSPGTSPILADSRPAHNRTGTSDSRRASMPIPSSNPPLVPSSRSGSLPRGRPPMPHPPVQGIQYQTTPNPWTALPTQRGYIPTAMPVSPFTHSMSANTPSQNSLRGSRRGKAQ